MKKILIVLGTRPEAIKMAPLIKEFARYPLDFNCKVCSTGQHREMLNQVLDFFEITPDYHLDLMRPNQSLDTLFCAIMQNIKYVYETFKPDMVFVHGDTTTSTAAALCAYLNHIEVAHIEAGLRTWNKWSPFPEEMNRQLTARLSDIHYAPTKRAKENLLREGVNVNDIIITGNTVIDALNNSIQKIEQDGYMNGEIDSLSSLLLDKEMVLVTGHRRENFGEGFINICNALCEIALERSDIEIIYPVHLNPNVRKPVQELLSGIKNIRLIEPVSYPTFVWLMNRSKLVITDSGGIQEEAPSLGKPVLVMRDNTERPEALEAGTALLVGSDTKRIVCEALDLLSNPKRYSEMSHIQNPYGRGDACYKIVKSLL